MRKNWETKKLGEVCEIGAGNSAPQKKELFDGGKYPFFRTSDVGRIRFGVIDDSTDKLNEIGIKKLHFYKKGTLLFPKSGASTFLNHRVLMATDGYVSSHLATLKAKDNILDDRFLLYFSSTIDSRNLMQDQNYPSLRLSDIQEIIILLPYLPEQKRIVGILDKAFAAIAKTKENAEKNLQNARELFESYLQGVFANPGDGWQEKKLGEISKINYGYTEKSSFIEVGPKFLRITDIQNNDVNWESVPFCKCSKDDIPKYKLESGDIVFARTGATTGKSYLLNNPPIAVFASYLIRLKILSKFELLSEFVYYFFQTRYYWDNINAGVSGSAQGGFNATKLGELIISYPKSLPEQKRIVAKLDALSAETKKLEAIYQQKITDLEELKKSVLQKAFNGELAGACS